MATTASPGPAFQAKRPAPARPAGRAQATALRELAQAQPFGVLQAKLVVGPANDRFEQEADQVADSVMRMVEGHPAGAGPPSLQLAGGSIQRLCHECEEEVHSDPAEEIETAEQEAIVQPKRETAPGPQPLDAGTVAGIEGLRGRGQPLASGERAFFEPRFGRDFSQVRIHHDGAAGQVTRAIGARAFTIGGDVAFAAGQYAPDTDAGRRLLAHELTHVVQQGAAGVVAARANRA